MFPPAVGGSGVLLENVYSRLRDVQVTVLVDRATCGEPAHPRLTITPTTIDSRCWGLFRPGNWRHHMVLARQVYDLSRGRAIVHCGRSQPEAIAALLAGLLPGGAPYVFWAHGEDISAGLSSREFKHTMRFVYRGASAAIANSRNTASLIDQTGWYRGHVDVVYPGVDAARFHPGADDGTIRHAVTGGTDAVVLLSVARLQRRKGHDLVVKALPHVLSLIPNLRYVIVGDGPELAALKTLSADLGVERIVHFAGEIPDAALPAYYAAADVFVLPTRVDASDFEGFGIVFLEAAASGKPVVAGRNGGVPEAVVDGQTGQLIEADDLDQLVAVLRALCSSRDLRRRFGENGRARAVSDFTWDAAARSVEQIHDRVASRFARRSARRSLRTASAARRG
jgi:phosphatidylinositol alpha-1,6-mannosyltransferase